MIRFARTFESNIIALLSLFLTLRQLKLMFQTGAHFMGAGCVNYERFQCQIMRDYAPSGFSFLLTAGFMIFGVVSAWKMLCGRSKGLQMMIIFYALQIPILASLSRVYHFPTGLNLYLLHQIQQWAIGINFFALTLTFALFGLWQNACRPCP